MRKRILSTREKKSKDRFKQLLVGLVLIFLMVLSTLGYALTGNQEETNSQKVIYNGLEFINQNGYWLTQVENLQFGFRHSPKETERMDIEIENDINNYLNKPLYIKSDDALATAEIYVNLDQIVQRMQSACIDMKDCEDDLPVKDCSNNFIIIEESNMTLIEQNQSCVFIQGSKENLTMVTDEFLFNLLGIHQ